MSRAYSQDLRDCVIDAALNQRLSAHAAAERFGIREATAIEWMRRARETGRTSANGAKNGSKDSPTATRKS